MNETRATKWIGQSVERLEDPPLVTGQGRFAGDINFPKQLHMRIVRSNHAHGKIISIDLRAALAVPGVIAVWTAADIPDVPPIDFREGPIEKLAPYRQPVLATGKVRFVGDPVAAVFAEDAYVAEDAADLVTMEIEELPPLLSAKDTPGEFSPGRGTEADILRQGYGDIDAAFRKAHTIVELELSVGRHSGVPLETRGAIGRYDAARDMLELHGAAKVPHRNQELIARMLKRKLSQVNVFESHVGGGFGIRGELYPEDILVCVAAMRLGRPVKWIEDRREHLIAANHSRNQHHKVRAAVAVDGEILAIDDVIFHDQGAYVRTHATRVAMMTCGVLPGPYRVPLAYRAVCHFRLTNKTPAATYRAPGRFETSFVRERLVDAIAHKLKLNPIEVRKRNAVTVAEMPFKRPLEALGEEIHFDSGDYHKLLDRMLKEVEWEKLNADLARRRSKGEMVGAGLVMFVEKAGLGPKDGVNISVDPSGAVEVVTGGASLGQGFETVMAQVAAEMLGVDYRRVTVIHGQTDRISHGIGAHASRATVMTASATRVAALNLREKALKSAAELLQAPVTALDIVNGEVVRTDSKGGPSIGLGQVAAANHGKLEAEGWHHADHQVYPYGNHLAVVKVDPGTGGVTVERYVIAYDIGRAINPTLVKGQIAGGCAQGLGGALLEEFTYNDRGDPLAVTFADYLLPTVREVPDIEIILTEDAPSPLNPLGLKGAGESGINGVGAAIASAIDNAIGIPGAVTQLPVTPQRLKAIIDGRRSNEVRCEPALTFLEVESAMNKIDTRATSRASNVPKQDLRAWLAQMEAAGEVNHVSGARREEEIGGIVDFHQRKIGNPAVLFDDVPGYPRGHRVLANILTSVKRINLTLGNDPNGSEMELVRFWRRYMKEQKSIPPVTLPTGALLENVNTGDDIDLFNIPVPKWHEHDGGYYIGTGCMVIMRDPDSGWINYGAYRVQAHDKKLASVMCSKGKHGDMIQKKYHQRGEPCPVAVVCGMHPALFMIAGLEIPYGKNEYDVAGGLLGEAVEVILGPKTGLPIPAHAEIAFEGFIHPNDLIDEGPLGEWTGYYAGGLKKEPAIRIETMMYRDNPILLGAIPGIPPDDNSFYRGTYRSGAVWNQLEGAGVPEVKGVWSHAAGGSRLWLTVAIKQMYAGHSKQAGLIASQCHAGAYVNRFVVVVDDDIDPADMDKVIWAMCTRFDPREGLETLRGCWSSALDPMAYAPDDPRNARVVIDACRPWSRRDTFPIEARPSKELDARIRAKFGTFLPKGS